MASEREKLVSRLLESFPEVGSRTIARLLHEQYPHEFSSTEAARSAVRYLRGKMGEAGRKKRQNMTYDSSDTPKKPSLPRGVKRAVATAEFNVPGTWLVIGDLHCPYHDELAVEAAIAYAKDVGAEHIAINGDGVDFYKLSTWAKDPTQRDPEEEIEMFSEVLRYLAEQFPGTRVLKAGNHESRFQRYLSQRAPAIMGMEVSDLSDTLRCREHGFCYVAPKQLYRIGNCTLAHGDEVAGSASPKNPSSLLFRRIRRTAVASHFHRTTSHTDNGGVDGRPVRCYTTGCMCDMSPQDSIANDWNQGFAIVRVDKDCETSVTNHVIDRGKVV